MQYRERIGMQDLVSQQIELLSYVLVIRDVGRTAAVPWPMNDD
jgi:hypothetical protein